MHPNTRGSALLFVILFTALVSGLCAVGFWQLTHITQYRVQLWTHIAEQAFMGNLRTLLDAEYTGRMEQGQVGAITNEDFLPLAKAAYADQLPVTPWGTTTVLSGTRNLRASGSPFRLVPSLGFASHNHELNNLSVLRLDGTQQHVSYTWASGMQIHAPFGLLLTNTGTHTSTGGISLGHTAGFPSLAWVASYQSGGLTGPGANSPTGDQWGIISPQALPSFTNLRSWPKWWGTFNQAPATQLVQDATSYTFDGTDLLPTPPAGVAVATLNGTNYVVVDLGAITAAANIYINCLTPGRVVVIGPNATASLTAGGVPVTHTTGTLGFPLILSSNQPMYLWGEMNPATSKPAVLFAQSFEFNVGGTFETPTAADAVWGAVLGAAGGLTVINNTAGTAALQLSGVLASGAINVHNNIPTALNLTLAPHAASSELTALTNLRWYTFEGIQLIRRDLH